MVAFMFHMALCHDIVTENKGDKVVYNASSPDELALVNCAKYCGFEFLGSDDKNCLLVEYKGIVQKFKLLNILEFNSTRKRMSVIV